ncbi:hypothetical protein [Mycolicibacterium neoaurum]|uniref:hypothetical protein n=1 Tax=Mycolicibacterium neoaurum TaxID=1795 RepID=UPI001F4C5FE1|nr:hypothetical protein [Mycolicibacterium neoaurum]
MNKRRIIINIESDVSDWEALLKVARVVEAGKISANGGSYCYATTFNRLVITTDKPNSNGTIRFNVLPREAGGAGGEA